MTQEGRPMDYLRMDLGEPGLAASNHESRREAVKKPTRRKGFELKEPWFLEGPPMFCLTKETFCVYAVHRKVHQQRILTLNIYMKFYHPNTCTLNSYVTSDMNPTDHPGVPTKP